jgi:hypothetical protein
MIRILKGVSGYRPDKSSYQYGPGRIVSELPEIEKDLVRAGLAAYENKQIVRPIAEGFSITPRVNSIKAVIKRRHHV